jgi:hypothetical protein
MDVQFVTSMRESFRAIQDEQERARLVEEEHADRLMLIEKRVDDEARMKSLWGPQTPFNAFPHTPQQGKLQRSSVHSFTRIHVLC